MTQFVFQVQDLLDSMINMGVLFLELVPLFWLVANEETKTTIWGSPPISKRAHLDAKPWIRFRIKIYGGFPLLVRELYIVIARDG